MKTALWAVLAAISLLLVNEPGRGQDAQSPSPAATELRALVGRIQAKLKEAHGSPPTEADLANELTAFDDLLAKHQGEKTDDVAQILYMKALLYRQVLNNSAKAEELEAKLTSDFPDTKAAKHIQQQAESEKIRKALAVGTKFPDFNEKDLEGNPLSIANYKGKVVLIDFWATWCGPCVGELPNVIKTYQKHHDQGFEIIGISLDREGDLAKLKSFLQQKNMTWKQFYDGKWWQNKLATRYGVESIPATYLLDGEGKIIGKDLRGELLEEAVTKALSKS